MPNGLEWHLFEQTPRTMTSDLLHCPDSTINNLLVARLSKGCPPITQLNTAQNKLSSFRREARLLAWNFQCSIKEQDLWVSLVADTHVHMHTNTWNSFLHGGFWLVRKGAVGFSKRDTLFLGCFPIRCYLAVFWALLPTAPLDMPSGFVDSNS